MGLVCWHYDYAARFHLMRSARDCYLRLSIEDMHQCVVRDSVLTKLLTFIERKESDRAHVVLYQSSADYSSVLVIDKARQRENLADHPFLFHRSSLGSFFRLASLHIACEDDQALGD